MCQCRRHDTWVRFLGRSPRGRNGNPIQYSCLENPTDRGASWAIVHGIAKSQTQLKRLSKQHSTWPDLSQNSSTSTSISQENKVTFAHHHYHCASLLTFLKKRLFWSIWASLVAQLVTTPPAMQQTWVGKIPWRRQRLPTPVFWPGEFHGLYSPWNHKELDTTEPCSLSVLFLKYLLF